MPDRAEITGLLHELAEQEEAHQGAEGEDGSEPLFRRERETNPAAPKTRPWTKKRKRAAIATCLVVAALVGAFFFASGSEPGETEPVAERTFENYLVNANRENEEWVREEGQFTGWQPKPRQGARGKAQGFVAGVFDSVRGWLSGWFN